MKFMELLNAVSKIANPAHAKTNPMTDMEKPFSESGIDSLDSLVLLMYICELYGISADKSKDWVPKTPQQLHDLLMAHKTREPASVGDAIKQCK